MDELERQIEKLGKLKQYKDKPKEQLEKIALLQVKKNHFIRDHQFLDKKEEKKALELFERYIQDYEFENLSDLETLGDLVYNSVQKQRLENAIKSFYEEHKKNNKINTFFSDKLQSNLQELQNQILLQKKTLGIDKEQREDDLTVLQQAKKRFYRYIQENKHEFSCVCSKCGNMLLLRKRVKDFDVMEHPWFVGRWLCNFQILKDVKEGKLAKEDAVRYLMSAGKGKESLWAKDTYVTDYVDWLLRPDNWKKIDSLMNKK